jgi:hypothetical protein
MVRQQDSKISSAANRLSPPCSEESLIADTRAGLTPAELVERKLVSLLKSNPLPVSHVQLRSGSMSRGRS